MVPYNFEDLKRDPKLESYPNGISPQVFWLSSASYTQLRLAWNVIIMVGRFSCNISWFDRLPEAVKLHAAN